MKDVLHKWWCGKVLCEEEKFSTGIYKKSLQCQHFSFLVTRHCFCLNIKREKKKETGERTNAYNGYNASDNRN